MGALFRTAEAAAVERILLCGLTPLPSRDEVKKTALGTLSVPWQYFPNPIDALNAARLSGFEPVALEQGTASRNLYKSELPESIALIVGHERQGISTATLQSVRHTVFLPMLGKAAHSLNVSTATGIALYEIRRRAWYN